jgi:putative two-component system response regulator
MPSPASRPRVLIVEDDSANRALLTQILRHGGYDSTAVGDGRDGLRAARDEAFDLVLLDVELPGMNGLEVCRALRSDPRTVALPIILLTGRSGVDDVVAGLDAGADDFLGKPYSRAELMARMRSVLRLASAMAEVEGAHGVISALANAVEAKDALTEQHCERLSTLANQLGVAIGLTDAELRPLIFGAMLHDIGKIGVRDAILNKPGPLTPGEWAEMRRHPLIGERICEPLTSSRAFAPVIRHHHERWDGHGYPDRLRGEAIPIGARIVGLADAFDAIVHERPYRAARSVEEALDELRAQAGRQFDPALVTAFVPLIDAPPRAIAEPVGLPGPRTLRVAV